MAPFLAVTEAMVYEWKRAGHVGEQVEYHAAAWWNGKGCAPLMGFPGGEITGG